MPDLFTHYAAARLPAGLLRDVRLQILLVAGTFLPDLVSKSLYWIARTGDRFGAPSHSLFGLALLCYASALLLDLPLRRPGFACLFAGGAIHLFLDLLKESLGIGAVRLFFPVLPRAYELGWIPTEDVVYLLPLDLGLLLLAWRLSARGRPGS